MNKIYTIYKITNSVNNKCYIGFTENFKRRKSEHIRLSRSSKKNYLLYNAMKKYGIASFTWELLYQSYDKDYTLKVVEPLLIKEHGADYNFAPGGTAPMLGRKHSADTVKKMKAKVPWNKGKKFSMEARKRMSEPHKNRAYNPAASKNQGISNSCWWEIRTPEGCRVLTLGLNKFCKQHNLSRGNMSRLSLGQIKYYKGYSCKNLGKGYVPTDVSAIYVPQFVVSNEL